MKRFTYSSGGQQSSSKGRKALSLHGGTARKASSLDSPRKRKRSPGEGESGTTTGASSSKLLKKSDSFCEEEEDDDLDMLGTAALEEYEQTQKNPSPTPSPIPKPTINPQTSIPSKLHSTTIPKWHNPYEKVESEGSSTTTSTSSSSSSALPQHRGPASSVTSADDPSEKIRQLQEQNYSKDGEVKVLRSEKERLLEELRKKEEHMHAMQTQLLSDKQAIEQQLLKENKSLSTKLNFAEQEVFKLRENYTFLEQMQKSSSQPSLNQWESAPKPITPLKTMKAKQSSHQSKDHRTKFESTETFMPLSQMIASDVTPVPVGRKRPSINDGPSSKQARKPSSSLVSLGPSTKAISSSPKKASTLSSVKRSNEKLLATPSGEDHLQSQPTKKPSSSGDQASDAVVLEVPSTELTGTQLLMLLVHRNLLKIPDFKSVESGSSTDLSQSDAGVQSSSSGDLSSNTEPAYERKLTSLLSLLHVERRDLYSPAGLPSIAFPSISELYPCSPSMDATNSRPTPAVPDLNSTPVRKPKLQAQKPYTSGRLELARSRTRQASNAAVAPAKSYSASNTPTHGGSMLDGSEMPGSLFSSVNKGQLEKSIASLLLSADSSYLSVGASYSQNRRVPFSPSPFSASTSGNSVFILLKQAHDIITKYHTEQLAKIQQSLNTSGIGAEFVEEVAVSPKAIFSGSRDSSISSKTSSELLSPAKADQELVSQALEILETLVTYSKSVREHVLEQLPKFSVESRPSSSMDTYSTGNSVANTSSSADEAFTQSSRSKFEKETDRATNAVKLQKKLQFLAEQEDQPVTPLQRGVSSEEMLRSEGGELINLRSNDGVLISNKVWVPNMLPVKLISDSGLYQQTTPLLFPTTRGFGQLLSILLELPAPRWKESLENVLSCIRILSALAADCSLDVLERFSSLLSEDSIGICLDKEDPELTLAVLSLLSHMTRSPALAAMLCTYKEPSCIPFTCYQCLLEPPAAVATESSDTGFKIRIQILRLMSSILVTKDGRAILLEACSCAHEILKSLVALLVKLVDTVYKPSQWTQQEKVLLREALTLMHKIAVQDRYFDVHRGECEDGYIFALHKLSWLLKTAPFQHEECLVQELLCYCEELEESQEHSSSSSSEGAAMDTV